MGAYIARELAKLRKKRGLTLRELGEKVNITASAISSYESAKMEPSLEYARRLADFYEVSIDSLVGRPYCCDSCGKKKSKADILQALSFVCESGLNVSIDDDFSDGVVLRISNRWLLDFFHKYGKLLKLRASNKLDDEVLEAWTTKQIANYRDDCIEYDER